MATVGAKEQPRSGDGEPVAAEIIGTTLHASGIELIDAFAELG